MIDRDLANAVSKRKAIHEHLTSSTASSTAPEPGTAALTYYIFEGVLAGFIGGEMVHLTAWSGGGGGSTRNATQDSVNNPYMYALKTVHSKSKKLDVHGGPIPPGRYRIRPPSKHKKLGLSCFLEPAGRLVNNRDGFFIHKQGPHGSDGCVVVPNDKFEEFMEKLSRSRGGTLHVLQAMEGMFA
jgi:hypothetical protein